MTKIPTLVPLPRIKEILSQLGEEDILQYDGLIGSHDIAHGESVSTIEVKVVFKHEAESNKSGIDEN